MEEQDPRLRSGVKVYRHKDGTYYWDMHSYNGDPIEQGVIEDLKEKDAQLREWFTPQVHLTPVEP